MWTRESCWKDVYPKYNQSQPNLILNQNTQSLVAKMEPVSLRKPCLWNWIPVFCLKVKWSVKQFCDKNCNVEVNFFARTCTLIRNPNKKKKLAGVYGYKGKFSQLAQKPAWARLERRMAARSYSWPSFIVGFGRYLWTPLSYPTKDILAFLGWDEGLLELKY